MLTWFHRLRVSHKLMFISFFFLIPDSVLLTLFLFSINANIHFAQWEQYGNEYQRPLEVLLNDLPEHMLLSRTADRVQQNAAALTDLERRIDLAFDQLRATDARRGAELQFTDEGLAKRKREHYRAQTVDGEWRQLETSLATLSPVQREKGHLHLIADVRTMITHAGDASNLIVDPDLDSYYLMNVTLLALPQMQERLAAVMAYDDGRARNEALLTEERNQFAVFAAMLRDDDLKRIVGSTRTALNEDPNFYGHSESLRLNVLPALDRFMDATEAFIQMTTQAAFSNHSEADAQAFHAAGDRVRRASFELWDVADRELNVLLQKRIEYYQHRRARSLILAAMAVMAAISFVTFITRSISGPLKRQASELLAYNQTLQAEMQERQRVEVALRAAEEKYRSIFENAIEGIYQSTPDGRCFEANPTFARIYGYDSVAELQQDLQDGAAHLYVDPGRRHEFRRLIDQTGWVSQFESQARKKDGTPIWVSEDARAVRDAAGALLFYEGIVEDVTARKEAEAELARLNKELIEASRAAGMADVATGVLHNVGNVLNSVNLGVARVRERLEATRLTHLRKVVELFEQHRDDLPVFLGSSPQGQGIPAFLGKLTHHLEEENQQTRADLDVLVEHVDHIKQIVSTQQSYARVFGLVETLHPQRLIDDAIRLNADSCARHGVTIERRLGSTRAIAADRHKVLQILVNLLRNATQAINEANPSDRRVIISLEDIGPDRIAISVSDTGAGISPENLAKVFRHGFTTKKNGHGFGLHSCALAAREMKGQLSVHSDGPTRGATFTLELPTTLALPTTLMA